MKYGIYTGNFIFKYNLEHVKQEELLENPITIREDNQQPSLTSNSFEGSTTNSEVQSSNVEDSNTDTSILHYVNSDDIV